LMEKVLGNRGGRTQSCVREVEQAAMVLHAQDDVGRQGAILKLSDGHDKEFLPAGSCGWSEKRDREKALTRNAPGPGRCTGPRVGKLRRKESCGRRRREDHAHCSWDEGRMSAEIVNTHAVDPSWRQRSRPPRARSRPLPHAASSS